MQPPGGSKRAERESPSIFRDMPQFNEIGVRVECHGMRARHMTCSCGCHVQHIRSDFPGRCLAQHPFLAAYFSEENLSQPQRRSTGTVGLKAMMRFMDERIVFRSVLNQFAGTGNDSFKYVHAEREVR